MVDQVELVERVARALCQHSGRGHDDDWESYTTSARAALEASHHAEHVEALEQIRDLSGSGYDSDRAWALAMQLRARVVLQGWLPPHPNNTGEV